MSFDQKRIPCGNCVRSAIIRRRKTLNVSCEAAFIIKDGVLSALMHSKLWWCNVALNENWIIKETSETCRRLVNHIRGEREEKIIFNCTGNYCSSMRLCSFRRIFQMSLCNIFSLHPEKLHSDEEQRKSFEKNFRLSLRWFCLLGQTPIRENKNLTTMSEIDCEGR